MRITAVAYINVDGSLLQVEACLGDVDDPLEHLDAEPDSARGRR